MTWYFTHDMRELEKCLTCSKEKSKEHTFRQNKGMLRQIAIEDKTGFPQSWSPLKSLSTAYDWQRMNEWKNEQRQWRQLETDNWEGCTVEET